MKISFKDFNKYFKSDGCTDREVKDLFHTVKLMDKESRSWVVKWFHSGRLPEKEIEGVTASYLVDECGYRPLNALIALDWLKTDPEEAKYFILKAPHGIAPDERVGQEMAEFLERKGKKISPAGQENEDFSDIE